MNVTDIRLADIVPSSMPDLSMPELASIDDLPGVEALVSAATDAADATAKVALDAVNRITREANRRPRFAVAMAVVAAGIIAAVLARSAIRRRRRRIGTDPSYGLQSGRDGERGRIVAA